MTDTESTKPAAVPAAPRSVKTGAALRNYRIAAYVVGTGLLILVFVAMPLKYLADSDTLVTIIGPAHGFLFVVYLAATLVLSTQRRWPTLRMLLVMLAGTIPLLSFIVERRVHNNVVAGTPTW